MAVDIALVGYHAAGWIFVCEKSEQWQRVLHFLDEMQLHEFSLLEV